MKKRYSLKYGQMMISIELFESIVDSHTAVRNNTTRDFPGGAVVKNPPASAGDTGSIPGPGRSHMPRSN